MTCACGMDSVGACLVCGTRLCADHALRGEELYNSLVKVRFMRLVDPLGVSLHELEERNRFIALNRVRADMQPLFRFPGQRQAFINALEAPGVICGNCRVNEACRAAGALPQPTAPALEAGGSQWLRDSVAVYMSGDAMAWGEMAPDEALKEALFQDLIHLAREKAERVQVPVEWEAKFYSSAYVSEWRRGEVRTTEEVFHVVDVTKDKMDYDGNYHPESSPRCMNRYGQWGPIQNARPESVKTGWFSKKNVFRASWSDEPPQPGLRNILKRAAELLAPAA